MGKISADFAKCRESLARRLSVRDNFDIIERRLAVGEKSIALFYIDGFVKDGEMQRVMQAILALKNLGSAAELVMRLP